MQDTRGVNSGRLIAVQQHILHLILQLLVLLFKSFLACKNLVQVHRVLEFDGIESTVPQSLYHLPIELSVFGNLSLTG